MSDLQSARYPVLYLDPPWSYEVWSKPARVMKRDGSRHCGKRVASAHYATMSLADIQALPVGELAERDAALFLWVTSPLLDVAADVMRAWGFTYKTVAFCWVKTDQRGKPRMGLGHYTRSNVELCLLGARGTGLTKRVRARDVEQLIVAPIREHSRKPDVTYERIMRLFDGPYLELFARQQWPGWQTWGNQTGKFLAQPPLIADADMRARAEVAG